MLKDPFSISFFPSYRGVYHTPGEMPCMEFDGRNERNFGISVKELGLRRMIVLMELILSLHSATSWGGWIKNRVDGDFTPQGFHREHALSVDSCLL